MSEVLVPRPGPVSGPAGVLSGLRAARGAKNVRPYDVRNAVRCNGDRIPQGGSGVDFLAETHQVVAL